MLMKFFVENLKLRKLKTKLLPRKPQKSLILPNLDTFPKLALNSIFQQTNIVQLTNFTI